MKKKKPDLKKRTARPQLCSLVFLSTVLICAIAGCDVDTESGPVYWGDLIGTYEATYGVGADEQIMLLPDSTYLHTYVSPEDQHFSQSGRWTLRYVDGKETWGRVRFSNFINWYPMEYTCYSEKSTATVDTTPTGWGPYVQKQRDGSIRLKRCPSERQYYNKVK